MVVSTAFVMVVGVVGLGRGPEWVAQVPMWSVMLMLMGPRAVTVGDSSMHAKTVCVQACPLRPRRSSTARASFVGTSFGTGITELTLISQSM